jgi:hypothetical protein
VPAMVKVSCLLVCSHVFSTFESIVHHMFIDHSLSDCSLLCIKDLRKHIQERFSITIPPSLNIHYIHLHNQKHLLQKSKRWTLLAESWGTVRLAWCALNQLTPHVFVDTTGCAFTFLVAKVLAGCKVGAYVHYPTISTVSL